MTIKNSDASLIIDGVNVSEYDEEDLLGAEDVELMIVEEQ